MDLSLDIPRDHLFIRSCDKHGVCVGEDCFNESFILTGNQLIPDWQVARIEEINQEKLQVVFDLLPEVVLIGTGKSQHFLPVNTQKLFFQRNLGFEVMTTDAACRTFNVLASEGRKVVAALIL